MNGNIASGNELIYIIHVRGDRGNKTCGYSADTFRGDGC
jgi:hypothetical protein